MSHKMISTCPSHIFIVKKVTCVVTLHYLPTHVQRANRVVQLVYRYRGRIY